MKQYFSRKDAKAQSAAAFPEGFLCAFAPLREKDSLNHRDMTSIGTSAVD